MKELFLNLQPRERRIVIGGGLVLLAVLFYLLAWEPLDRRLDDLRARLETQTETLAWMRSAADEVKALRSGAAGAPATANRSLLAVIDESARAAGIKPALQRMEPEGDRAVRLWLGASSFDALVTWLGRLERQHGITVSALSLEPAEAVGTVEARITLERGG